MLKWINRCERELDRCWTERGDPPWTTLLGYADWYCELELIKEKMKSFSEIGAEVGLLVENKNKAYGSAFQVSGEILKLFFPNGCPPDKYEDLLLIARIIDKLMRIASQKEAFGESPYVDIVGYGILGAWSNQTGEW